MSTESVVTCFDAVSPFLYAIHVTLHMTVSLLHLQEIAHLPTSSINMSFALEQKTMQNAVGAKRPSLSKQVRIGHAIE